MTWHLAERAHSLAIGERSCIEKSSYLTVMKRNILKIRVNPPRECSPWIQAPNQHLFSGLHFLLLSLFEPQGSFAHSGFYSKGDSVRLQLLSLLFVPRSQLKQCLAPMLTLILFALQAKISVYWPSPVLLTFTLFYSYEVINSFGGKAILISFNEETQLLTLEFNL